MKMSATSITPCLWFDTEAEDAARHYVSIFNNSKIVNISHYGSEGKEIHGKDAGTVLAAEFEIEGARFVALNGGPKAKSKTGMKPAKAKPTKAKSAAKPAPMAATPAATR